MSVSTTSLLATVGLAVPTVLFAEAGQQPAERWQLCEEQKDWACAFDALAEAFDGPQDEAMECASLQNEGCFYEFLEITKVGIGAAEKADLPTRRAIAERAIGILRRMNKAPLEAEGELYFSALRYDACKPVGDDVCMTESAGLIRTAAASYDYAAAREFLDFISAEAGIHYPIDLEAVMAEVAETEKTE